ncbi:uncharacterized protein DS421_19g671790 [Arachis hypogaea]|uniref:Uncharacterized protein n=1 Tax=Arachis hypogaea TaxID=3818 RepID=A0A6B9VDM7_ARAHY|nr:uncharacterized protein DS421_19g671790 [Arachis hypogaea]
MDTGVMPYEINHLYIHDDPVRNYKYYIRCAAPCVRNYIVRDPEIEDISSGSNEPDGAPASRHHHLPNGFL